MSWVQCSSPLVPPPRTTTTTTKGENPNVCVCVCVWGRQEGRGEKRKGAKPGWDQSQGRGLRTWWLGWSSKSFLLLGWIEWRTKRVISSLTWSPQKEEIAGCPCKNSASPNLQFQAHTLWAAHPALKFKVRLAHIQNTRKISCRFCPQDNSSLGPVG